jgi:hypothetical protein
MMAYEIKNMTGSLWPNDKKTKETHPDRRGSVKIDGVEYWVSGWSKNSNGKEWESLSFTRKEETQTQQKIENKPEASSVDDDTIPF